MNELGCGRIRSIAAEPNNKSLYDNFQLIFNPVPREIAVNTERADIGEDNRHLEDLTAFLNTGKKTQRHDKTVSQSCNLRPEDHHSSQGNFGALVTLSENRISKHPSRQKLPDNKRLQKDSSLCFERGSQDLNLGISSSSSSDSFKPEIGLMCDSCQEILCDNKHVHRDEPHHRRVHQNKSISRKYQSPKQLPYEKLYENKSFGEHTYRNKNLERSCIPRGDPCHGLKLTNDKRFEEKLDKTVKTIPTSNSLNASYSQVPSPDRDMQVLRPPYQETRKEDLQTVVKESGNNKRVCKYVDDRRILKFKLCFQYPLYPA